MSIERAVSISTLKRLYLSLKKICLTMKLSIFKVRSIRIVVFLVVVLQCLLTVDAKTITQETASRIASHFISTKQLATRSMTLQRVVTSSSSLISTNLRSSQIGVIPMYYVFSLSENNGFLIISANDVAKPILGYSLSGTYDENNENFAHWMERLSNQISYAVEHDLPQTPEIKDQWEALQQFNSAGYSMGTAEVAPLINTQWNQGTPYNNYCPRIKNVKTVTGCVATAMAQILNYYEWPKVGFGSNVYVHPTIGKISCVFNTNYNWSKMLNTYTSGAYTTTESDAVATLMYHCGVALQMNYGNLESSASMYEAYNSLLNYFSYDTTIIVRTMTDYSESKWTQILKEELDNGRPIFYCGGNHAFICDGYDSDAYFHFNWGWGGYSDGYFPINCLQINETDYNEGNFTITGIRPSTNSSIVHGSQNNLQWNLVRGGQLTYSTPDGTKADITSVEQNAMEKYVGIVKAISISGGISSIETGSFIPYYNLEFFTVDATNTAICASDGVLYDKEIKKLYCCPPLKIGSFVVPKTVTELDGFAFSDCRNLSAIDLPNTLCTIGSYAFNYCFSLKTLSIPKSVNYLGEWALSACIGLDTLYVYWDHPLGTRYFAYEGQLKSSIVLSVPYGCKGNYIPIDGWSVFSIVSERDATPLSVLSNNKEVTMFPNPCSDHLSLESDEPICSMKIMDCAGRVVVQSNLMSSKMSLNLKHLPTGNYLVLLKTIEDKIITKKLIKL
jgi:hypothetical protein